MGKRKEKAVSIRGSERKKERKKEIDE